MREEHSLNPELYQHQQGRRAMGPRFRIVAPAWFRWQSPDGSLNEGCGTSRDISGNGVFMICYTVPSLRAEVEVSVNMPSTKGNRDGPQFYGKGVAIRVEQGEGRPSGFAAEMTWELEAPTLDPVAVMSRQKPA